MENKNETTLIELDKVISNVLEDWSMMLTENVGQDDFNLEENEDSFYKSTAIFSGDSSGKITLICPKKFLEVLSENLLDEDEAEEQDLKDCLQELTNIVSGNFLTEYFGTELIFDLPDFSISKLDKEEVEEILSNNNVSFFLADDEPIGAFCDLD